MAMMEIICTIAVLLKDFNLSVSKEDQVKMDQTKIEFTRKSKFDIKVKFSKRK
jgi:hypothetical protein